MTKLLLLALTLAQARTECKKAFPQATCELWVNQTTTTYVYRVRLRLQTVFGREVVTDYDGKSWEDAMTKAKTARAFSMGAK